MFKILLQFLFNLIVDGNLGDKAKLQVIAILGLLVALLTGFTALNRYERLKRRAQADEIVKMVENKKTGLDSGLRRNDEPKENPPVLDVEKAAEAKDVQKLLPRNILFTFAHYRATAAYVAGDFNGWVPEPMKKEKVGIWRAKLSLEPGTYKYNFIANGVKYRDRYNSRRSGLASVLVVEALKR